MIDRLPQVEKIDDNQFKQMILERAGFSDEAPINVEFFTKNNALFVRYENQELSFVEFWKELKTDAPKMHDVVFNSIKKLAQRNGYTSVDQFVKDFTSKDELRADLSVSTDGKIIFRPEKTSEKE